MKSLKSKKSKKQDKNQINLSLPSNDLDVSPGAISLNSSNTNRFSMSSNIEFDSAGTSNSFTSLQSQNNNFQKDSNNRKFISKKWKNVFSSKDKQRSRSNANSLSSEISNTQEVLGTSKDDIEGPSVQFESNTSTIECDRVSASFSISQNLELECTEVETRDNANINLSVEKAFPIANKQEQDVVEEDIWLFFSDPSKFEIYRINMIISVLKSNDVHVLYRDYGYNKTVLFYAVVAYIFRRKSIPDTKSLLKAYTEINRRRLLDLDFYNSFSDKSSQIVSIKKRLKSKIKDSLKCMKCQKENVSVLFLPCGHIVLCNHCHDLKTCDKCTNCGTKINETHLIFY